MRHPLLGKLLKLHQFGTQRQGLGAGPKGTPTLCSLFMNMSFLASAPWAKAQVCLLWASICKSGQRSHPGWPWKPCGPSDTW